MTTTQSMQKCASCAHENASDAHFCKNCGAPLRKGDPSDPLVHRMVGNYRLLSRLGEGGFGVVYLAKHVVLDTQFAVKILHPQFSANEQVAERFRREALAAGKLRHEHVVSIADYGHAAGVGFYYAMEYLQGRSLKTVMDDEGPLPLERILHIAQQVTSAMQRVHEQQIIHRDLKPDNIFLIEKEGSKDYVKLVDFGIAKILGDEEGAAITKTGLSVGTPLYMSPEQARGQLRNLDHRTDIYSWSIILFEMLTGKVPFFSEAPHEVLLMHIKGRPPRLSDISSDRMFSPELEGFFRRLLSKNPQERPESMVDLYRQMEKHLRAENAILDLHSQPDLPAVDGELDDLDSTAQINTPPGVLSPDPGEGTAVPTDEVPTDLSISSFDSGEYLASETPEPAILPQVLRSEEAEEDSNPRGFRLRGSPELRRIERFAAARKRKEQEHTPEPVEAFETETAPEKTEPKATSPYYQTEPVVEEAWSEDEIRHDDEPTATVSRDEILAHHLAENTPEPTAEVQEDSSSDTAPVAIDALLDEQDEPTMATRPRPATMTQRRVIPQYKNWFQRLPLAARIGIPAGLVLLLVMAIFVLQNNHNARLRKKQAQQNKLPPGHLYAKKPKTRTGNIKAVKRPVPRVTLRPNPIPVVRVMPGIRPLPHRTAPVKAQKPLQNRAKPLKTRQLATTYVTLTLKAQPRASVSVGGTKQGMTPLTIKRPLGSRQRIRIWRKGFKTRVKTWSAKQNRVWDLRLKRVKKSKKVTPQKNGQTTPKKKNDIFHTGPNPFKTKTP